MDTDEKVEFGGLRSDVRNLIQAVKDLEEKVETKFNGLDSKYVSLPSLQAVKDRVSLLEKMAFGVTAVVVLSVIAAVVALVIRGGAVK